MIALAIEGAILVFILNWSRQYLIPFELGPLAAGWLVASCSFLKGKKCGNRLSFYACLRYSMMGDLLTSLRWGIDLPGVLRKDDLPLRGTLAFKSSFVW